MKKEHRNPTTADGLFPINRYETFPYSHSGKISVTYRNHSNEKLHKPHCPLQKIPMRCQDELKAMGEDEDLEYEYEEEDDDDDLEYEYEEEDWEEK